MLKTIPPPNYTQVPNTFFDDLLSQITSLAELKVTLAIIRSTFGWHKNEDQLSLSQLEIATGMTRESVSNGIMEALKTGLVKRRKKGQSFLYGLRMELVGNSDQLGSQVVGLSDQQLVGNSDPQKKEEKERKKARETVPPEIRRFQELTHRYPKRELWPTVVESMAIEGRAEVGRCWLEWLSRGYNSTSIKWLTEWHIHGIPHTLGNGIASFRRPEIVQ